MKRLETDVIAIGGGAIGTGTLRDLALRGVACILIERNDLASGTTGRNHGLLHSGARYAVNDTEFARECIAENTILRKIAQHCIEPTGGLFVGLAEDDPAYHEALLSGCREAGIDAREIDVAEALRIEPNLNPDIQRAARVPDATIDPFRLASANVLDATEHGGRVLTHTEVTEIIVEGDGARGVHCVDKISGEQFAVYGKIVVNATGVWGQQMCQKAGVPLRMFPSKGSLVVIDYRINRVVLNRSRKPADGDIFVPGDTVSLIGTTSREIPYDRIEELTVDDDEIDVLLADGEKLVPNVTGTRLLRAYCGVRPLVALTEAADGRDISRGIVLIDHQERDGLDGFVTIAGGKLVTYRLMAEMTADLVCRKLGIQQKCLTAETPLPGSEKNVPTARKCKHFTGLSESVVGSTHYRHGERVHDILDKDRCSYGLICECEMVTSGEVTYALDKLHVRDLNDLRRRTRIGMGPCQGALCAYRAAGLMAEFGTADGNEATQLLAEFLEERFKGVKPVLWGDALREIEFTYWIYHGLLGLGDL